MKLNLEKFVRIIKKYDAGEFRCEFDFVNEGERYKASIAVKRFRTEHETRNRQTEGFCAVDEMIEEEEQDDDDSED